MLNLLSSSKPDWGTNALLARHPASRAGTPTLNLVLAQLSSKPDIDTNA